MHLQIPILLMLFAGVTAADEPTSPSTQVPGVEKVSAGDAGPAQLPQPALTNAEKDAVIREVGEIFHKHYVFPEKGKAIEKALQGRAEDGAFDSIENSEVFRKAFRDTIRNVVDDKHIIILHHDPGSNANSENVVSDLESQFENRKTVNFGIPELKILDGNIGYMKITKFTSPELFSPKMRAASEFLKHVDGLILDLRSRGGGRSETVLLLLSYFLPSSTHVFNWHFRDAEEVERNWTLPYVDGHRFMDIPIIVLTSQRTFSGSEAVCYAMKHHGRASVVGETTRGGAHTYREILVCDRYLVLMPYGRALSIKTGTNWEGRGVVPTVPTSAAEALATAMTRLNDKIKNQRGRVQSQREEKPSIPN